MCIHNVCSYFLFRDTNKRLSSSNDELRVALKVRSLIIFSEKLRFQFRYQNSQSIARPGYTRKNAQVVTSLQTSCYKSVHKLSTSCVRTACSQLLEQVWNELLTTCNKLGGISDLSQGCSNKSDTVMI
jgi:hypothetical protein